MRCQFVSGSCSRVWVRLRTGWLAFGRKIPVLRIGKCHEPSPLLGGGGERALGYGKMSAMGKCQAYSSEMRTAKAKGIDPGVKSFQYCSSTHRQLGLESMA